MTPKAYMILGLVVGIVGVAEIIATSGNAALMTFAAGALFGKGYGLWEDRSK